MESYSDGSEVDAAAKAELRRLDELSESAWFHQNLKRAPLAIKIGVLVVATAVLTLMGAVLSNGDSWGGVALVLVLSLAFVFAVTRLERRYSRIRTTTAFPPRAVLWRQLPQILLMQVPLWFFIPVFLSATERGATWWMFAAITGVFFVVTFLWILVLARFAVFDKQAQEVRP